MEAQVIISLAEYNRLLLVDAEYKKAKEQAIPLAIKILNGTASRIEQNAPHMKFRDAAEFIRCLANEEQLKQI